MARHAPRGDASIVAVERFIHATRDSGYRGTLSAVAEFVDNSLQADRGRYLFMAKGVGKLSLSWPCIRDYRKIYLFAIRSTSQSPT
jgi:hypothetical protein